MKYYSEVLDKIFNSTEELEQAEKEFNAIPTKKELAKKIESLEADCNTAYENYKYAINELTEAVTKVREEGKAKIKAALANLEKVEKDKANAISQFNKYYGVYSVTYTGEQAQKHCDKMLARWKDESKYFKDIFNKFYF